MTDLPSSPSSKPGFEIFIDEVTEQAEDLAVIQDHLTRVLRHLDINEDWFEGYDEPNRANKDLDSMVKVFLYREILNLSDSEVARRTSGIPYFRLRFGFNNPLVQQTLSHNWRNRFTSEERPAIREAANKIRSICHREEILYKPDPGLGPEDLSVENGIGEDLILDAVERATDIGFDEFSANRADNATHPLEAYFERQGYLNMAEAGTTTKSRRFARLSPRDSVPGRSAHNRTMKKVADPDDQLTLEEFTNDGKTPEWKRVREAVLPAFHTGVENMIEELQAEDRTEIREPVNVAIDIVKWPFWASPFVDPDEADENDTPVTIEYTNSTKEKILDGDFPEEVSGVKESHRRAYKFATLTIVADDTPIVLAIEPVRDRRRWESEDVETRSRGELVGDLLDQAEQHVDINKVYADREFDTFETFTEVDRRDDFYVIPKSIRSSDDKIAIKKTIEHEVADVSVEHATLHHDGHEQEVSIAYVPKDSSSDQEQHVVGDYVSFIINAHVSPDRAMGLAESYRDRWTIENEYKSIKANFLPKSASKDYRIRFLYFVIGVMMYNVWRLSNFYLRDEVDVNLGEDPPILGGEIVEIVAVSLFDPGG